MPNLRPIELILILAVILLLFGAKKLPALAGSIGRSLTIFKRETKSLRDEDDDTTTTATQDGPARPLTAAERAEAERAGVDPTVQPPLPGTTSADGLGTGSTAAPAPAPAPHSEPQQQRRDV